MICNACEQLAFCRTRTTLLRAATTLSLDHSVSLHSTFSPLRNESNRLLMVFAWKTVSMASPETTPPLHQRTACVLSFLASSKSTFSISRRASPMDILCFTTSITNLYLHHNGDTIVFTRPLLPISRRSRKYHGLGGCTQKLKG